MMRLFEIQTETMMRHQHEATARHVQRQNLSRALSHPARLRRARFYQPALTVVGRRLVIWGMRLQRLYPEPVTASTDMTLAEVTLVKVTPVIQHK